MAWRWVATMALVSACVTLAVWLRNAPQNTPPKALESQRQFSDAKRAQSNSPRQAAPALAPPDGSDAPIGAAVQSATALPSLYDTDIAYLESSFGIGELTALAAHGRTTLELPGHGPIELTLARRQTRHGMEQLSAIHAGLTSTFTRRGERFFATLATPTESYRLESAGSGSRLYPQRQLAARAIRHEKDFRHVH